MEELCFLGGLCRQDISERRFGAYSEKSRVEAGSNTSTVALRVVGCDEKGNLESEIVRYGRKSHGTRTQKLPCWRRPAASANDRPVLSSERAPYINNPATVWQLKKSGRKPRMGALFQARLADWPSVVTYDSDSELVSQLIISFVHESVKTELEPEVEEQPLFEPLPGNV
jgi:hypothetical protein